MHRADHNARTVAIQQRQRRRAAPLFVFVSVEAHDRSAPQQHVERPERRDHLVPQVYAIRFEALHPRLHANCELDQIDRLSVQEGLLGTTQPSSPARRPCRNHERHNGERNTNRPNDQRHRALQFGGHRNPCTQAGLRRNWIS